MTDAMLKAFRVIDKFETDYRQSADGIPLLIDLVYYYPEKRAYEIAKDDFFRAALEYCRLTP